MKSIKNSNDSTSPSPLFFTKEFVVQQCKAIVILEFFSACPLQAPSWCGSLRRAGFVSVATAIALCPIGGATIITII
jgi:hypothetical protein